MVGEEGREEEGEEEAKVRCNFRKRKGGVCMNWTRDPSGRCHVHLDAEEEEAGPTIEEYVILTDEEGWPLWEVAQDGDRMFFLGHDGREEDSFEIKGDNPGDTVFQFPYSDDHSRLHLVALPSGLEDYGTVITLYNRTKAFFHEYAEIFEKEQDLPPYDLLAMSAMLTYFASARRSTWLVNIRGPPGTGKTRAGELYAMISFRALRGGTGMSYADVWRTVTTWGGALFVNEMDQMRAPEQQEWEGFLLERTEPRGVVSRRDREDLRKSEVKLVFGDTLITTRERLRNDALEDRLTTILMRELSRKRKGQEKGGEDGEETTDTIPHSLPPEAFEEAQHLVNQLQKLRCDYLRMYEIDYYKWYPDVSARISQTLSSFSSLAKLAKDRDLEALVEEMAVQLHRQRLQERAESYEGHIVRSYFSILTGGTEELGAAVVAAEMDRLFGPFRKPTSPGGIGRKFKPLGLTQDRTGRKGQRTWLMNDTVEEGLALRYLPPEERETWEEWVKAGRKGKKEVLLQKIETYLREDGDWVHIDEISQQVGAEGPDAQRWLEYLETNGKVKRSGPRWRWVR